MKVAKQTFLYTLLTTWIDNTQNDENTKPFYLNLCGAAGCGKTFWLHAISKYVSDNVDDVSFLKKTAPTELRGTADFLLCQAVTRPFFSLNKMFQSTTETDNSLELKAKLSDYFSSSNKYA